MTVSNLALEHLNCFKCTNRDNNFLYTLRHFMKKLTGPLSGTNYLKNSFNYIVVQCCGKAYLPMQYKRKSLNELTLLIWQATTKVFRDIIFTTKPRSYVIPTLRKWRGSSNYGGKYLLAWITEKLSNHCLNQSKIIYTLILIPYTSKLVQHVGARKFSTEQNLKMFSPLGLSNQGVL